MGLTKIPTRTDDSLGRQKYDQRPATDLETQIQASEYNATADAVIAVSEAVGLADGSTPGSLEARMADALARLDDAETCCATNSDRLDALEPEVQDHEQRITTLEQEPGGVDQEARGRLDVIEPQVAALEAGVGRLAWGYFQPSASGGDAEMVEGKGLASLAEEVEPGVWSVTLVAPGGTEGAAVTITSDSDVFCVPVVRERFALFPNIHISFVMLDGSYREGPPPPFSIMVQA